jgi:hypothetical protein
VDSHGFDHLGVKLLLGYGAIGAGRGDFFDEQDGLLACGNFLDEVFHGFVWVDRGMRA